jgi:hypothetical protein
VKVDVDVERGIDKRERMNMATFKMILFYGSEIE